jgi:uncharacterized protein
MTRFLSGLGLVFACLLISANAAEILPPVPKAYFNDDANLVPVSVATRLNEQLAQFERDSSNQLLVVTYPKLTSDSSIEDFANRTYQAWGVGRQDKDNGAVLFVWVDDRKMRIEVGYGLEAKLTDAESFRIIEEMKPHFRSGDYATGLSNAVTSMIAATQGEYTGTGQTSAEGDNQEGFISLIVIGFFLLLVFWNFFSHLRQIRRNVVYGPTGSSTLPGASTSWWSSSSSSGGSSWGDSGGSSFSGGGGSSGGGGASGGW